MKYYIICIFALLALASASAKVRINLETVSSQVPKDLFFSVKARRDYVHNYDSKDFKLNDQMLVAKVRVGTQLTNDNGEAVYQTLAVDTGSSYSWYERSEQKATVDNLCTQANGCDIQSGWSTEIQSLNYANPDSTQNPTVIAKGSSSQYKTSILLQNKFEAPAENCLIEYAQKDDVKPKINENTANYNGVLAFQQDSVSNVVQQLYQNKKISSRIFSIFMAQETKSDSQKYENFVTIGDYEKYLCSEKIWDANVKQNYKTKNEKGDDQVNTWEIQGGNFRYTKEDGTVQTADFKLQTAVFDSSTFGYWAEQTLIDSLKDLIQAGGCIPQQDNDQNGRYTLPCQVKDLHTIKLRFGGQVHEYNLPPQAYTIPNPKDDNSLLLNFFTLADKSNKVVFGRQFNQFVYTIYDIDNSQILLSNVYLTSPDTVFLNETIMWLVIVFGTLFIVLTFAALLAILQPIKYVPRKEVVVQAIPQQVVYVQQQPGMQQSLVRSVSPINYVQNGQYLQQQVVTPPRY